MKKLKIILLLLALSMRGFTQAIAVVSNAHVVTADGVGGWSDVKYFFKRGDRVHVSFTADKQLNRITVTLDSNKELAKVMSTRAGSLDFVVPEDGEVIIRFISDRRGQDSIDYTVTKVPGR